jgi:hypothetical protein
MKTSFNDFNIENLIQDIKNFLIEEYDYNNWKEFIDNQKIGDCQSIVFSIIYNFPICKKYFGEIKVDYPSIYDEEIYDEDIDDYVQIEKENYLFTHHWIEINNIILDFSKGTLKNNIDWNNIYDIIPNEDSWRYQ